MASYVVMVGIEVMVKAMSGESPQEAAGRLPLSAVTANPGQWLVPVHLLFMNQTPPQSAAGGASLN
jgi:hypothetical protein